jgi:NAD(P)-dependent dehydrogenase (short-subunit alcohol dehydrogenase family)
MFCREIGHPGGSSSSFVTGKKRHEMRLLENKVAIVTGAARGIGRSIAETYAEHGANVIVTDIVAEGARSVAEAINSKELPKAVAVQMDVSNPQQVEETIQTAVDTFGKIDILVNNAAILKAFLVINFPLKDWQDIFRVNMEGTFLCSQAAAREMIKQGSGGVIINIASASARKADRKHAAYSASKAAMISFTRILALELGEYGIRANAILPGATLTEMLQDVFDQVPGIREELIAKTTLGKLGDPKDQANAAVFLGSDMASHITGEHLIVSGGEFMNA